ncbi:MAG TPA: DUF4142 domain-containing protein, partial [Gammaproteobacteria bacterium]|nr:DUF4142 domain-containing protein [Gammaproteobacteria bacterium]
MQSATLPFVASAALAVTLAAVSQSDEQTFIKEAVQRNLTEVQLGELAAQRAEAEPVRKFAESVRTDHQAALQRATNLAKSLKVEPPTDPATEARGIYD